MKKIEYWAKERGLVLKKWQANTLLSMATGLARLSGDPEVAARVLGEANFRIYSLPKLSPEFQKRYLKANE